MHKGRDIMDINNILREYIELTLELDRLKKEHDASEERIKVLEKDISFYEEELSHIVKHLDTNKYYKNLFNLTLKQIITLFGIDAALIISGRLSSDAMIGLITALVASPIITANVGKSSIEKYEKSEAYTTALDNATNLEEKYLKDKWELEQLEVEKEDLFNCYLEQLVLVTNKRRELAEASKEISIYEKMYNQESEDIKKAVNCLKRIRKIEK